VGVGLGCGGGEERLSDAAQKHKSYRYPTLGTRTKNVPKVGHPVRCHSEALLGRWGCGRSLSGFCWWRTGFCGRGEDEILADQGEALLGSSAWRS